LHHEITKLSSLAAMALAALFCLAARGSRPKARPPPARGKPFTCPWWSHVYLGAKSKPYDLTKTFTFRNRDRKNAVTLVSIVYFNGSGDQPGRGAEKFPGASSPWRRFQMPGRRRPNRIKPRRARLV
jgi:hypothetical protein